MEILGVKIDNFSKKEIYGKINFFLNEPKFHQIATINPELVLEAQKNLDFKNILNGCNLNIADGVGIKLAFLRYGRILKARMTGADLMLEILRLANEKKLSVFLACRKNGLSSFKETRDAILKLYPELKIEGMDLECHSRESENPASKFKVFTLDSRFHGNGTILLCSFGAPYQEIFINSIKCDTIRLAMGVGGSFDFLTGKISRAPKFLRRIGLEWLWRLIQEPRYRWKRILRAITIFPLKIIMKKHA